MRSIVCRGGVAFLAVSGLGLLLFRSVAAPQTEPLRFAILGDRTGDVQAGVYEQAWKEVAAEDPAFVLTVGDTIEGMHDATAETEWQEVESILKPYRRFPLYLAPGNHDIWSEASKRLFVQHAGHPPHYSFDHGSVHVAILDNSRSDELAPEELTFLEEDLKAHESQPVKMIFSHRPSWLLSVALRNTGFPLHRIARRYGVQYVIAGHVHQLLRFSLEGIEYISMPSAGGHLRPAEPAYEGGWFFGHALATVRGTEVKFQFEELKPPLGHGRVSTPEEWGMFGLLQQPAAAAK
jgi:UDP-2,3-diacylglucosamine pyrophosphatase LpxH